MEEQLVQPTKEQKQQIYYRIAIDFPSEYSRVLKMVEYELVFEGVETKEELDTVVSYGCDVIQGFYFDRPLPANEFVDKYYTGSREITYGT